MTLLQLLNNAERHVREAQTKFAEDNFEAAKDDLADLAGMIQRQIGGVDAVDEEPAEKEEKPSILGQDQQAAADAKGS